ncbi:hypothetical protein ACX3PU_05870 [Chryseobacterium sp. A301]
MMRQHAINNTNIIQSEKIHSEKEEIDKLKKEVKESEFYSQLSKHEIWKLDTFGIPRTISWSKLLNKISINNNLLDGYYKLYCNYAHSEFVSIMQLNQMNLNNNMRNAELLLCIIID